MNQQVRSENKAKQTFFNQLAQKVKLVGKLEGLGDKMRELRKPKLRTSTHYLCDICDNLIKTPHEGYVIHGNIYNAAFDRPGGLIGDNFPQEGETEVKKTVLCVACMKKALNLS